MYLFMSGSFHSILCWWNPCCVYSNQLFICISKYYSIIWLYHNLFNNSAKVVSNFGLLKIALPGIKNLWLPRGRGSGRGMDWEFGVSRCKLLYIEWINNKVLLYSTGNHIHYPVINHNGKEYEKQCIYIYITESLCCIAEINTTL